MSSLVTVIIPVYNVEPYIKRCLDSISNQTYRNIEIIAVDDGSEDKSALICDECASIDSRIRVIKKQNEGAGYARNAGMDIAKGEYIFFVDSDDYILDICIERLVEVATREKADIVKCAWIKGSDENYRTYPKKKMYSLYNNVSAFRTRKVNIAVNGKLYRREVIGELRYPKETVFDDEFFTYQLIYSASKIIVLDEAYYYYYLSPNSIMRGLKKKQPLQFIKAFEERIDFFERKGEKELADISHKELAIRLMLAYITRDKYVECDISEKSVLDMFRKEYSEGKKQAVGVREKASLYLFNLAPNLVKMMIKGQV